MDNEVEYLYTVHDCIGCLVSDTEKVKEIMERTAKEMYGVRLELKIEELLSGLSRPEPLRPQGPFRLCCAKSRARPADRY